LTKRTLETWVVKGDIYGDNKIRWKGQKGTCEKHGRRGDTRRRPGQMERNREEDLRDEGDEDTCPLFGEHQSRGTSHHQSYYLKMCYFIISFVVFLARTTRFWHG